MILFGSQDVNLKKLEAAFPEARIVARGNELLVSADVADLARIETVLKELRRLIRRHGELTDVDVETVLALNRATGGGTAVAAASDGFILNSPNGGSIRARTPNQIALVEAAVKNDIVFAIGPAGTGKTYTAVALAVAALQRKQVKRIVLCRPAVEAGEQLGFLPGGFRDKVDPYLRPLYDALGDMIHRDKLALYMEQNSVEIVPLAYMRGRTLNSAFVILDEAQNATTQQMKMFLTRIGANSRSIITGDITQIDLPRREQSGLIQAQEVLKEVGGIEFVAFDRSDVVRHRLVKDIIKAYADFDDPTDSFSSRDRKRVVDQAGTPEENRNS
ncbi:MAG: PhoH family protein [Bacteroidetes bacterium]|nr:PhoH family protein [Bacteroidota bacterium]